MAATRPTDDFPVGVGDWLTIDGQDYRLAEYDAATEQFFVLRHGHDAGEFLNAYFVAEGLRRGVVTIAIRQLALAGLAGAA